LNPSQLLGKPKKNVYCIDTSAIEAGGFTVTVDGKDVPGGDHDEGHHSIKIKTATDPKTLLDDLNKLPWKGPLSLDPTTKQFTPAPKPVVNPKPIAKPKVVTKPIPPQGKANLIVPKPPTGSTTKSPLAKPPSPIQEPTEPVVRPASPVTPKTAVPAKASKPKPRSFYKSRLVMAS